MCAEHLPTLGQPVPRPSLDANVKSFGGMLLIFVTFGGAYLLSSLLRGVTATLAPTFVQEFTLQPTQLGMLAGAYFLGFALMQLPAGAWLDRYGAKRVLTVSLTVAAIGSCWFGSAGSFAGLLVARFFCGVGVSACLIAPLTFARLHLQPAQQQQVNLWMLMVGALGLLLATLPTHVVAGMFGWQLIFVGTGVAFAVVIAAIVLGVPESQPKEVTGSPWFFSYGPILKNGKTWKMAPLGFFSYAILVAVQTLWAGPWLTDVAGLDAEAAAQGLFGINLVMLLIFLGLGLLMPHVIKSEAGAQRALRLGLPFGIAGLLLIPIAGIDANWVHFAIYCVGSVGLALTHPTVGQMFPPQLAGRAIAFFNLLLFLGVFVAQWGVGRIIELVLAATGDVAMAYQIAFSMLAALSLISYLWFLGFDRIFIGRAGNLR
jgi:MFS family permease